jgi:hypothetical protein
LALFKVSAFRSQTATRVPSFVNSCAEARPIPVPPPVKARLSPLPMIPQRLLSPGIYPCGLILPLSAPTRTSNASTSRTRPFPIDGNRVRASSPRRVFLTPIGCFSSWTWRRVGQREELKIEESRSTAGELATFDPEVARRVKAALDKSERLMVDSIRQGQTDGSIPATIDHKVTARLLPWLHAADDETPQPCDDYRKPLRYTTAGDDFSSRHRNRQRTSSCWRNDGDSSYLPRRSLNLHR